MRTCDVHITHCCLSTLLLIGLVVFSLFALGRRRGSKDLQRTGNGITRENVCDTFPEHLPFPSCSKCPQQMMALFSYGLITYAVCTSCLSFCHVL